MKERAGSRPPTSSITMWIDGSPSTRAASLVSGNDARSRPSRGRVRSVSATAARVRRAPARSSNISRRPWRISATPAPTVPRPSRPMRTPLAQLTVRSLPVRSAAQLLEAAQRLADPLLVLDEREPHVALSVFPEADARRHGHLGLLDQELGELERAQALEGIGDRRPHEHRALRLGHVPADLVEPVHQDVAALSVHLDDLVDALLVGFQGDDAGDLDRLEGAVVQVGLDAGQRGHHSRIAQTKPRRQPAMLYDFEVEKISTPTSR